MTILKRMIVLMATLMGVLGLNLSGVLVPDATAAPNKAATTVTRYFGACGGGTSLADMMAGWQRHGVIDDVARSAGQTPGLDGSASNIVRGGIVEVVVVRGAYVRNFTCKGGVFDKVSKLKWIPAGSRYFVPERLAPKPCEQKRSYLGWEARCGNKQLGGLLVRRACAFVAPKPLPKPRVTPKPVAPVKIVIRKQAFSAAAEEQLIFPTPTNVFRFKVQCGLKGKPRYIVYQSDPQPAGTCPVSAGRVLIWELLPLGPDKWKFLSPTYQTFKLKGKKVVLVVYKNKQVKEVTPTPTPVPPIVVVTPAVVTPPAAVVTPPAAVVPPKTSVAGPGTTTPGVPGGAGAGGTPGTGSGLKCVDRTTEKPRDAASNEYSDMFGYCTKK